MVGARFIPFMTGKLAFAVMALVLVMPSGASSSTMVSYDLFYRPLTCSAAVFYENNTDSDPNTWHGRRLRASGELTSFVPIADGDLLRLRCGWHYMGRERDPGRQITTKIWSEMAKLDCQAIDTADFAEHRYDGRPTVIGDIPFDLAYHVFGDTFPTANIVILDRPAPRMVDLMDSIGILTPRGEYRRGCDYGGGQTAFPAWYFHSTTREYFMGYERHFWDGISSMTSFQWLIVSDSLTLDNRRSGFILPSLDIRFNNGQRCYLWIIETDIEKRAEYFTRCLEVVRNSRVRLAGDRER